MKKSLFFVAIATLFFASCQKEVTPSDQSTANKNTPCFKASIEQLTPDTKAYINASNQLVWYDNGKTGDERKVDKIGIYFPSWGSKNQSFTLSDGAGTTKGTFTRDEANEGYDPEDATIAFFPWQGTGSDKNNVYDDPNDDPDKGPVMYFNLKDWYDGYEQSGQMLTPLVASISSSENVTFKHVGAAVKLTINNLVAGGYKAKMTVNNKQITGSFQMTPANAGTEAIALTGTEDVSKNHITLNSRTGSGAFSWVFPVPALDKPKLKFEIKDENGVKVWSRSLAAQSQDLGRKEILVMPPLDVTAYDKWTKDETAWTFSGNVNGSTWKDDIPMMTDGEYSILSGYTFAAGDEFKIRKDNSWDEAYPSSNWKFNTGNAGTKDIIFNRSTHEIQVVSHNYPYPVVNLSSLASSITINGTMSDWAFWPNLTSTGTSRIRSWKFTSDDDYLYFYLVLRKNKCRTAYQITLALKWNGSGTQSGDNLSGANALIVFQPFTNSAGGNPTCVNGSISSATVNGTAGTSVHISAYGSNPNTEDTSDSTDYYLEFSIKKSDIPSLPTSGSINIGVGYEWYNTSYQSVTL